jgi:hypothetical protein
MAILSDDKAPFKLDNLDNLYVQNLYPPGGADKWTPDKVRSNIPFPNTVLGGQDHYVIKIIIYTLQV